MSYRCKVVFAGDTGVGKTCIVDRLVKNIYNDASVSTVGAAYRAFLLEEEDVVLGLWDTAGQERFHSMTKLYYRDAGIIILVFDVTKKDSVARLAQLLTEIKNARPDDNYKIIILGNKIDLADDLDRDNILQEVHKHLSQGKLIFVSAKDNMNIEALYFYLVEEVRSMKRRNMQYLELVQDIPKPTTGWRRFFKCWSS